MQHGVQSHMDLSFVYTPLALWNKDEKQKHARLNNTQRHSLGLRVTVSALSLSLNLLSLTPEARQWSQQIHKTCNTAPMSKEKKTIVQMERKKKSPLTISLQMPQVRSGAVAVQVDLSGQKTNIFPPCVLLPPQAAQQSSVEESEHHDGLTWKRPRQEWFHQRKQTFFYFIFK